MLAGWGVPPEKIAALLAEGWTPEDLPPMVGTKWWRLLLPDEARRTDAAAALARARGSVPSDDEREEELSEEGTDTGDLKRP